MSLLFRFLLIFCFFHLSYSGHKTDLHGNHCTRDLEQPSLCPSFQTPMEVQTRHKKHSHPGENFGAAPGALSQSAASAGATAQALGFASKIMSHL